MVNGDVNVVKVCIPLGRAILTEFKSRNKRVEH